MGAQDGLVVAVGIGLGFLTGVGHTWTVSRPFAGLDPVLTSWATAAT